MRSLKYAYRDAEGLKCTRRNEGGLKSSNRDVEGQKKAYMEMSEVCLQGCRKSEMYIQE